MRIAVAEWFNNGRFWNYFFKRDFPRCRALFLALMTKRGEVK